MSSLWSVASFLAMTRLGAWDRPFPAMTRLGVWDRRFLAMTRFLFVFAMMVFLIRDDAFFVSASANNPLNLQPEFFVL